MSLHIITVVVRVLHIAVSRSLQCRCLVSVSPGPVSDMQRPVETCREWSELETGDMQRGAEEHAE